MNLEEKSNKANGYNFFGKGGEKANAFNEGYHVGYIQCLFDLKAFIKANPKITADKITEYLNSL